ncbi:MAG: hypothetical protein AAF962_04000 [Actinomycetota bacterium]
MSDLDIQIDVPDDDDLDSSVRVLSGDIIPPWLKAAAILILGGLAALMIAAFLLGRTSDPTPEPLTTSTTVTSTSVDGPTAMPATEQALSAIDAWADYARTGDLAPLGATFDPAGPQYAMFEANVADPRASDVTFAAGNVTESTDAQGVTTVSLDLAVTSDAGTQTYPYDFVFLEGSNRVWTVTDRRSPGQVALPPPPAVEAAARQTWSLFVSSVGIDDGIGAAEVVSDDSIALATQVGRAAAGDDVTDPLVAPGVFEILVDRAELRNATEPGPALVAMLDPDQREAIAIGGLTSWTMVDEGRVVATLEVAGQAVASVPFVATAEGWAFDLKGALETTGSTDDETN